MEGRASGVAECSFGQAEFGLLVEIQVCLSSRQWDTQQRDLVRDREQSH